MNFQMFKLDLEKAEEPEIKLPSLGSSKKHKSSRKTSTSALLTTSSGQGPHLGMTAEPLGFSRVAVGYLSYHREFMLSLVLAHKSLIFHSRFEEELEVRSSH